MDMISNKKNVLFWVLCIVLLFTMLFTQPMGMLTEAASKKNIDLQILATSDLHGRFVSYEYASNEATKNGSLAQISTAVKELRKNNKNTILVDNGDTIQDNSSELFLDTKTHPMIAAMNEMGYDTWTLGNHEFDYLPKLEPILKQSKATVLCGNVYRPNGKLLGKDYTIINKNGIKIGVIGMVTPDITKWNSTNLEGYTVADPIKRTKEVVKKLKGKADLFIAVEHMGIPSEYGNIYSSAEALAKAVPELSVIIAGHTHIAVNSQIVNGVLITQPSYFGQAISKIDVTLHKTSKGYKVVSKSSSIVQMNDFASGKVYEEDRLLVKKLSPYHQIARKDANRIIGELKGGNLVPEDEIEGIREIYLQPTPLISLIHKVQIEYGNADVSAAAAFRNDANVMEGKLTKSDAAKIYKYDNTLTVVEVTGAQLRNYMEWSAQYYNTYKPGDLTVSFNQNIHGYTYDMFSGVEYNIDLSKPSIPIDKPKDGFSHYLFAPSRITNLKKNGKPVKDNDTFKLAVNNFRYDSVLKPMFHNDLKVIYNSAEELGDKGRIREFIIDYLTKHPIITNETENNWKLIGLNWNNQNRELMKHYIETGKLLVPAAEDGRTLNIRAITEDDLNKIT